MMEKKNVLFAMAAGLFLTACAQPEIPQDKYYRLSLPVPAQSAQTLNGVVEVERFRADGLISGRPIIYKDGEGHLSQYFYHFWVEPPVDLLQDSLVKYLRDANFAKHVVTPAMRVDEDYLLTAQIKKMERHVGLDEVEVEIEVGLVRESNDEIMVLKTYNRKIKQTSSGVGGAVNAMNAALGDIFAEFLRDAG